MAAGYTRRPVTTTMARGYTLVARGYTPRDRLYTYLASNVEGGAPQLREHVQELRHHAVHLVGIEDVR